MGSLVRLNTQHTSIATLGSGLSVLGQAQARIPVGGKIRSGIKVLVSAHAKNSKAVDIYQRGVLAGQPWDKIDKDIREALGLDRSPLTPKNVPYFTARRGDFSIPEVADRLMHLYGEDRGDGLRLYRFPVILPLDNWQAVMPHGLKCYTRSELVYWSEYAEDGNRYCFTHGAIERDAKAKRAKRAWGGRPVVLRDANDGHCEPDSCQEYQSGKCKLSGGLLFYVPGVPGSSAIQMPSTSFYSLSQWRQQMEMVGLIRGRISGTGPNGKPIFYLTKRQEEVSMIDPDTGAPKRVKQYLVHLETDIDMSRVYRPDDAPALTGPEAASLLGEAEVVDAEDGAGIVLQASSAEDEMSAIKRLRSVVFESLKALGIDTDKFAEYGAICWGDGWGQRLDTLESAKHELIRAGDDIAAYVARINATLANKTPF